MPFNSIYPPLYLTKPTYNGTNIEETGETTEECAKRLAPIFEKKRKEEKRKKENIQCMCDIIGWIIGWIIIIIVLILAIYIFSILLGTIMIASNYVFENTMVALFGQATYNKNFPICTNDIYQGNDCYTRTSTYCN